jgi:hypothetical protein
LRRDGQNTLNAHAGKPQATDAYSSERLSSMGMVGIYKREGDQNFQTIDKRRPTRILGMFPAPPSRLFNGVHQKNSLDLKGLFCCIIPVHN